MSEFRTAKKHRAGRLAKQTHAEHVQEIATNYSSAFARYRSGSRAVVEVQYGRIFINGELQRVGDVKRMTRELERRAQAQ